MNPKTITPFDSPALCWRHGSYPEPYAGRVPRRIRILMNVFTSDSASNSVLSGLVYDCWVDSHGSVSVIRPDGILFGLMKNEFEVVSWHGDVDAAQGPDPEPAEDRRRHYRIWWGGTASMNCLNPYEGAVGYDVVAVGIGWSLGYDAVHGVVFRSVFGETVTAFEARSRAMSPGTGFRRVRSERIASPLRSISDVKPL